MEKEEIVPNIIDKVPDAIVKIKYSSGVEVHLGNELTPTQVKDEPSSVEWPAKDDIFYTLLMIDPDAPSRKEPMPGAILHWFVGNIPGNHVKSGEYYAAYRGSGPPKGTGLHRYVFLVFKQSGKIEFGWEKIDGFTRTGRREFFLKTFTEKYGLGEPVAGNFYQAQFDDWVPIMQSLTKQ